MESKAKLAVGARIKEAREIAGISISELARRFPVPLSRSAVAQWEAGLTEPSAQNLRHAADILSVTLEWLGLGRGDLEFEGTRNNETVMADGELVDLKKIDPEHAKILTAALAGNKKAEVWRLTRDILAGAGYRPGDYLVVDTVISARANKVVLVEVNRVPLFRVFLPPCLYTAPMGPQPAPLIVDNIRTVVRGAVTSHFSLS
jgi:transcriptional regulator with XRE-family HTH domain